MTSRNGSGSNSSTLCTQNIGMARIDEVEYNGTKIIPLQFLKAVLPNPQDLGENYHGETSIGCRISGFLKTLTISPLPRVLEVSLILRLIVGRIKIVYATLQTGIHYSKILIRQSHVYDQVGL